MRIWKLKKKEKHFSMKSSILFFNKKHAHVPLIAIARAHLRAKGTASGYCLAINNTNMCYANLQNPTIHKRLSMTNSRSGKN